MKENVKIFNEKKVVHKCYSIREIREIVCKIEKDELCISEASEIYDVKTETVKSWLRRYSKIIEVTVKHRLPKETKKTTVRNIQAGIMTVEETAKKYGIDSHTINRWMKEYSINISATCAEPIENGTPEPKIDKTILKEIEELNLKVIALETMIDVAETELNIDIRKKSGTKRSL